MHCCRKSNKNIQPAWHARYEAPCSAQVLAALSGTSERDTATGRQKLCPAASRPDARLAAFQTSWSDKTTLVSARWNSLPSVGRRKAGRPGLVLDRHTCRIRQPFILIDFGDTVFRLFLQDGLRQQTKGEGRTVKEEGNRGTAFCLSAVKTASRINTPVTKKGAMIMVFEFSRRAAPEYSVGFQPHVRSS